MSPQRAFCLCITQVFKGSPSPKVSDESSLTLVFVELTSLKIFPLEPFGVEELWVGFRLVFPPLGASPSSSSSKSNALIVFTGLLASSNFASKLLGLPSFETPFFPDFDEDCFFLQKCLQLLLKTKHKDLYCVLQCA
jgi:hypothetical protein